MAADTKRGADEETVLVGKLDGAHISIRLDGLRIALAAQGLAVVTKAEADELAALRGRVPHTHPTDAALKLDLERLQAGMAELETDRNEWVQVSRDWRQRAEASEAAKRELRELRGRVARIEKVLGDYMLDDDYDAQGAIARALETLRGR